MSDIFIAIIVPILFITGLAMIGWSIASAYRWIQLGHLAWPPKTDFYYMWWAIWSDSGRFFRLIFGLILILVAVKLLY